MTIRLFSFIAFAFFVLTACAPSDGGGANSPIDQPGVIALSDQFNADFDLVDFNGEQATDERFRGKPMFIYLGFTMCPDVCPASLGVMSATLQKMGNRSDQIQPVFITIDPERDTQEQLKQYLDFDDRILGLTGSQAQIDEVTENLRIYAQKVPLEDSGLEYTMDHLSLFFFIDAEGVPTYAFKDSMAPKDLAAALKHLIG